MRGKGLAVAVVCLFSLSLRAQSTAEQDESSRVRTLETVWNQAEIKGDVRALDLIFDSSMIYIDEDGALLSKTEFLNRVAKETGSEAEWLVTPEMRVNVYGETAVVIGSYRVTGMRRGKRYQRTGHFIDTWALKDGAWRCVVAQATPVIR